MNEIPGYVITTTLDERGHMRLAAGTREADGAPVLLKAPLTNAYRADDLETELALLRRADGNGAPRPVDLVSAGSRSVLVMEDDGCRPLTGRIGRQVALPAFYSVAVGMARALAALHGCGVAHLGLTPDAVLVADDGSVRLINLEHGCSTARQEQPLVPVNAIRGDLHYLAPEQTGRMLAEVDERADLYSLGVLFYEMITGVRPFDVDEPLELVHAHLAVTAVPVSDLRPDVPPALAALVGRLLAKSPAQRYRSADGVAYDLDQLARGPDPSFALGRRDLSPGLRFSERLVGREHELGVLLDAFTRADDGRATLVLVAGDSGSGKSRLVQGLAPLLHERDARWAEGKFDEFRRDEPYLPLAGALGQLVEHALTEPEDRVAALRDHLSSSLAGNGAIITRLVPASAALIGEWDDVPELQTNAADTRFRLTVLGFVEAWARTDRTVVLFFDDLQWADPATLDLCRMLLGASGARILIIGAYRSNEVGPGHVLNRLINATEVSDRTTTVSVGALGLDAVTEFVADSLFPGGDGPADALERLAALVNAKSGGNAFFLRQLIAGLVTNGALTRDTDGRWQWDTEELERWQPTDNVAELMSQRIQYEIPDAADTLAWGACLGHEFDLGVLAEASELTSERVAADVATATLKEFVRMRREGSKISYRFAHDRIREAAYASLDADERRRRHLALGRTLRRRSVADDSVSTAATDQLDEAIDLITDPVERRELVGLNHQTGRRALTSSSPHIARTYLERAMDLLGVGRDRHWSGTSWTADYPTTMAIATDTAKALWLSGASDELDELCRVTIDRARQPLDVVPIYDLLIQHRWTLAQHEQSIEIGHRILAELDERVPSHPGRIAVAGAMLHMRRRLGRRGPDDVRALPRMTDAVARAKMLLLNSLMAPAYMADQDAMAVMIFRMCELSLEYGNAPESAFAWTNYGFVLCHILGKYDRGHAFAAVGMEMVDQPDGRELRSRVQFTFTSLIDHWTTSLRRTYPGYRQAFNSGLEVGDLNYAALSRQLEVLALLTSCEPLAEVRSEAEDARAWMVQHRQDQPVAMVDLYMQVVDNLRGAGASVSELAGPVWSDVERREELERGKDRTALGARDVAELWLALLAGDRQRADIALDRIDNTTSIDALVGSAWIPQFHFLAGLALAWPGHRLDRRLAAKHHRKLQEWAELTPEATSHRSLAVEAAIAHCRGRPGRAIETYEAAATAAANSGAFFGDLGLICERAAMACDDAQQPTAAAAWRQRADRAYARWGMTIKTMDSDVAETTVDTDIAGIDMRAMLRLSQAVTSELRLDDLLRRVLTIALEVGGARFGHLISQVDHELVVVANGSHGGDLEVLTRTPIDQATNIVPAIVNFVARRREPVILDNASQKGPFVLDPSVRRRGVRSVLCAPLITQGDLVAIVYLENDLVDGAFKPDRLSALSLLSTSASSAITNATLVDALQKVNAAYERFVPADFVRLLGEPNVVNVGLGQGVEREVAVLFADIRGFTSLSETLTPGETFRVLNDYLEVAVPIIEGHGGIIDKYVGDAIMAFFPKDPGAAVRASLELLGDMERFNDEREAEGKPRLDPGVGLHTGPLMLGTVGTARRMDGTVIGDTVNLSSRVEGLTKIYGARLLTTEAVWDALDPLERPHARLVDRVRAAGKTRPISLYHVLTPSEVGALHTLDVFNKGCAAYFASDFATAERYLVDVLGRHPQDAASKLLLARCRAFQASGLPSDWDGVTTHDHK
jgi:predicted ATPase/class 3 adenylate cyclase